MTDLSEAAPLRRRNPSTGGDTVTVACNLPNGLTLRVFTIRQVEQCLPNGKTYVENDCTVDLSKGQWTLNGQKIDHVALAAGQIPDYRIIKGSAPDTGYSLTPGIPRDFWELWLEQNQLNPLVVNRHVFAAPSEPRAADQAREYQDFRSGFQGINQAGDYRVPTGRAVRRFDIGDNRISPEQAALEAE